MTHTPELTTYDTPELIEDHFTSPMDALRHHVGRVEGLPFNTPEAEDEWNTCRTVVDAYGADVLGTIAVGTGAVTSIEKLNVADFDAAAPSNIAAYYAAHKHSKARNKDKSATEDDSGNESQPQRPRPSMRAVARMALRAVTKIAA